MDRLILFFVGILLLGSWLIMDNRLKGVVFFWAFPLIGVLCIILALVIKGDKK
jgi:hypothetical protein